MFLAGLGPAFRLKKPVEKSLALLPLFMLVFPVNSIGPPGLVTDFGNIYVIYHSTAIQSDGKIVVAGTSDGFF